MGFQEDIKVPRPHGTINDTVIRVSYRVSRRYQSPPGPTEQLTIQSLGFLIGIQEDIKVIRPHETIDHIETRFFLGFQEDIKIIITITIIFIIITIIIIIIVVIFIILACPDARRESGQTSGACRDMIQLALVDGRCACLAKDIEVPELIQILDSMILSIRCKNLKDLPVSLQVFGAWLLEPCCRRPRSVVVRVPHLVVTVVFVVIVTLWVPMLMCVGNECDQRPKNTSTQGSFGC